MELKRPLDYAKAICDTKMREIPDAKDLPPAPRFHYHQGVFLSGMMKTYALCGEQKYFNYVKRYIDTYVDGDGNVSHWDHGQMDDIQPGILLYPLYDATQDPRYVKAMNQLIGAFLDYPRNDDGGLWHKSFRYHQMWLDGLYMGGPFMSEYGERFGRPEYTDFCVKQALLMEKHTKDPVTGLFFHAFDDSRREAWSDPVTGCSHEFWGRSVGWVPVGLLDDLDHIPEDHPQRAEVIREVTDLLKAVCRFQSEDGRWYQVVNKGSEPDNWLENSCSSLFSAALFKAVRKGFLPEEYLDIAWRGYEGVIRSLEYDGDNVLLGHVCIGTGVSDYQYYIDRPTSVNDLHGMGAFLIMCAEAETAARA